MSDNLLANLEHYQAIYQRACERKGGPDAVESLLNDPDADKDIARLGDDRFLAEFSKKVFQSGFVWRVVRNKWPEFERLFFEFNIDKVLLMPDEMLEKRAQDPAIIRNYKKVQTIRDNAIMIDSVRRDHDSFAQFVANWPATDITGLWAYLKKNGARLGGNTGPYALRALGKDTFLLTRDVTSYFSQRDIISGGVTSKRSLSAIQAAFNQLQAQSGRSMQALSTLIAISVGDNLAA